MSIELLARADSNRERPAIVDPELTTTYAQLVAAADRVAAALLGTAGIVAGDRVAYLIAPCANHVAALWGIWKAGGIAVPLALSHPVPELEGLVGDASPICLLADAEHHARLAEVAGSRDLPLHRVEDLLQTTVVSNVDIDADAPALMVYTSGTTGRPKGVVVTHAQITAQVRTVSDAWGWTPDDTILHALPLHHVHGLQVALGCSLYSGACCEFLWPFDASAIWERFASGDISVFMAVPTVYRRLVAAWDATPDQQERWSAGARGLRLMVSGSAALPVDLLDRWRAVTGQRLLERYGMTEIGMALSNPLAGERRAGAVGQPLPGVEVRVVDAAGNDCAAGTSGQIMVRGPQVFRDYWCQEEATAKAFRDGWFLTGDEAVLEDGYYRIVGRRSVDIIKSGGYKLSALEIEEVLRAHPGISEIAVVGVEDPEWGERVCAVIERVDGALTVDRVRAWARERLAPYKVPKQVAFLEALPRNAMGKVTKPPLRDLFGEIE